MGKYYSPANHQETLKALQTKLVEVTTVNKGIGCRDFGSRDCNCTRAVKINEFIKGPYGKALPRCQKTVF
eukprot:3303076-Ditylum_brightwellii.AAC.1